MHLSVHASPCCQGWLRYNGPKHDCSDRSVSLENEMSLFLFRRGFGPRQLNPAVVNFATTGFFMHPWRDAPESVAISPAFATTCDVSRPSSAVCDPKQRLLRDPSFLHPWHAVLATDESHLYRQVKHKNELFARACPLKQERDTDLRSRHADGSLSTNRFRIQIVSLAGGRRFTVPLLLVAPTFLDDRS